MKKMNAIWNKFMILLAIISIVVIVSTWVINLLITYGIKICIGLMIITAIMVAVVALSNNTSTIENIEEDEEA